MWKSVRVLVDIHLITLLDFLCEKEEWILLRVRIGKEGWRFEDRRVNRRETWCDSGAALRPTGSFGH